MYFDDISFRYEFRDYQKRVLDSLPEKTNDNKLHIVAAPGSGKTVLGLEIIRRNDSPCLVLVPSISIREQWIDRFMELFVPEDKKESWAEKLSTDIEKPGIITCITYQALFALSDSDGYKRVISELKNKGYKAICLDESHHLKREWWKALVNIWLDLGYPLTISLTATPPYDSDNVEWERYNSLCGEIDCEVLTPEMVKKHTLCPHQDHVYLSVPTEDEIAQLNEYIIATEHGINEILTGETLYRLMCHYDAITNPVDRAELFIEEPRLLNSLIAYIKYYGIESVVFFEKEKEKIDDILNSWDVQLKKLAEEEKVRPLKGDLLEILLNTILFKDSEHFDIELLGDLKEKLKKSKILVNNKITIARKKEEIEKLTRNSLSKMDSIRTIVVKELQSLGDNLQMVVLVDNIGKEELSCIGTQESLGRINCVSVFEMLRRLEHMNNLDAYMKSYISYMPELSGTRMGLLCGSFAILPETTREKFDRQVKPLGSTGYFYLDIGDNERREIVATITELLEEKAINVLVGTVSLLGEGWDAPCVNSVLIGSTISSFVQTNQMRGRGLRLDSKDPFKTSNIWHLATLGIDAKTGEYVAGDEYKNLIRRFETILGISYDGTSIGNGIERLGLPGSDFVFSKEYLDAYTKAMLDYAGDRDRIMHQWNRLTNTKADLSRVRDVVTTTRTRVFRWNKNDDRFTIFELRKIALGLHRDMVSNRLIGNKSSVNISFKKEKGVGVYLDKCTPKEGKLYSKYYEQVIGELVAPRYIICKGIGKFRQYIPVPDYCKNKAEAETFKNEIGFKNSRVIYTRNPEGIKLLFELRIKNLNMDYGIMEKVRQVILTRR